MRREVTIYVSTDETGKLIEGQVFPFLDHDHRKPPHHAHLFVGNHDTIMVVSVTHTMTREAALSLAADYAASRLITRTIEFCSLPYRIRNSQVNVARKPYAELPAYPLLDFEW